MAAGGPLLVALRRMLTTCTRIRLSSTRSAATIAASGLLCSVTRVNGCGITRLGASVPNYNRINEWPLQFLRTGNYRRSYGYLYGHTTDGDWWSNTASSATYGHILGTWPSNIYTHHSNFGGGGVALGCVFWRKWHLIFALGWGKIEGMGI